MTAEQAFPWHIGVFDAHCHPTDTMDLTSSIPQMKARTLTIMATRSQDQELVAQVANATERVVPCFGWHPWFSHQLYDDTNEHFEIADADLQDFKVWHYQSVLQPKPVDIEFINALPQPRSLADFIAQTNSYLDHHPVGLVGEIGLDKSFRLPVPAAETQSLSIDVPTPTPGGREGRKLSPYKVSIEHQKIIFKAQLRLAGTKNRPVSVHDVQAHGVILETMKETWKGHERQILSNRERKKIAKIPPEVDSDSESVLEPNKDDKKPYPPKICMHSCAIPKENIKEFLRPQIPAEMFFSFSAAINLSEALTAKTTDLIKLLPDDRILVESDLHIAGEEMDDRLEEISRKICQVKGWSLEDGVAQLGRNWKQFVVGEPSKNGQ
jgi:Tat protein secretion system quality control protein TatD with DNase activity